MCHLEKLRKMGLGRLFPLLFLLTCWRFSLTSGANILIAHPLYSGSHVLTLRSVAESLTQRGHQVHIVRWRDMHSFPAVRNGNITETVLSMNNSMGAWKFLTNEENAAFKMPYEILWNSGLSYNSIIEAGSEAFPLMEAQCDTLLSNNDLRQKLQKLNFQVAIIDILYNECSLALLHQLQIPAVGYWAFPFSSGEADYTTAFLPSSHVPAFMSRMTHQMTFSDRIYNVFMKLGSHLTMQIQCYFVNRSVKRHLPGTPNPCDLIGELNGMLINTDYAMDYPRLLPPTFINVGGMQIREPRPLPNEIEKWMDSSGEHGVVLFTMGFIFNPQVVPKRLVNAFMEAFSRLPQKFLVKFEGPIDFVPPNVKVLEWIPQQDVLAHPKTRLFLTHCGLHGVMEGIYYGVPMVGMPIFIDQGDALIKMEELGIALGLDKETATADDIYDRLYRVLSEPHFRQNVHKLSLLMRDVQEPPLERAIHLIHYLIRHNGAPHLKLASRHLNFTQYFSLDVIAFLAFILSALIYIQFLIYKRLLPIVFSKVAAVVAGFGKRFIHTYFDTLVAEVGSKGVRRNKVVQIGNGGINNYVNKSANVIQKRSVAKTSSSQNNLNSFSLRDSNPINNGGSDVTRRNKNILDIVANCDVDAFKKRD